ncbi:MAG: cytochrome D1 domain-containing protein [Terriglobia bacterium]|nr:cytochrome D1 domain-containing protein [Terriglobia bacterium]
MKKLTLVIVLMLLAVSAVSQTSKTHYQQTAKWTLGGEGFWDYLLYDPVGHRLFAAHNDKVLVIDASNGKQIGEIPTEGAHGTALVQDKGLGFCTNGRAGTVTVFDLKTLAKKTDIKVGENPDAIIYDRYSKHVIVMNGRSHDMMAIDPSTLKVVADVPLGGKLEFAASDRSHVYVNVEDKGEIGVVDSKTWKQVNTWKLNGCQEPSGLALDEKTDRLFAVCGDKKMIILNAKTGAEIASVPTGGGTDADRYDPGLNYAFASNGEGTLTVVGEKNGKYEVVENVQTARGARTMELDPKTHTIYLATAEFGPPAEGQRRPSIKPGTFMILVYSYKK